MGVKGLWTLLSPAAQRVSPESLKSQRVAVDVSIWLHQFVKGIDSNEDDSTNLYLSAMFHRICKLLHYGCKPVFVFDGQTPDIKKNTVTRRAKRRKMEERKLKKIAQQLLNYKLQSIALEKAKGSKEVPKEGPKEESNKASEQREVNTEIYLDERNWEFNEQVKYDTKRRDEANKMIDSFSSEGSIDSEKIDPEVFAELPPDLQEEILNQLKARKYNRERVLLEKLESQSINEFSQGQVKQFIEQTKAARTLRELLRSQGDKTMVEGKLASDPDTTYVLFERPPSEAINPPLEEEPGGFLIEPENDIMETQTLHNEEKTSTIDVSKTLQESQITTSSSLIELDKSQTSQDTIFDELARSEKSLFDTLKEKQLSNSMNAVNVEEEEEEDEFESVIKEDEQMDLKTDQKTIQDSKSKSLEISIDLNAQPTSSLFPKSFFESVINESVINKQEKNDNLLEKQTIEIPDEKVSPILVSDDESITEPEKKEKNIQIVSENISHVVEKKQILEKHVQQTDDNHTGLTQQFEEVISIEGEEWEEDEQKKDEKKQQSIQPEIQPSSKQIEQSSSQISEPSVNTPSSPIIVEESPLLKVLQNPQIQPEEIEKLQLEIYEKELELEEQHKKLERQTQTISSELIDDMRQLLELFGLPYVQSPYEADSQCAFMNMVGIVDAVITEDSDVFLFGAETVYKHLFKKKDVQKYNLKQVEKVLGLNRTNLIQLGLLLGSDFTEGVHNVGIVTAMQSINAFHTKRDPSADPVKVILEELNSFKEWVDSKSQPTPCDPKDKKKYFMYKYHKTKSRFQLPDGFPDKKVVDAYLNPVVDSSVQLDWKKINRDGLVVFVKERMGWNEEKLDKYLKPILEQKNDSQRLITQFFSTTKCAVINSKRLQNAVNGLVKKRKKKQKGKEKKKLKK